MVILFLLDILFLLGSYFNPVLPLFFVYTLWFSSVLGLLLFFTRSDHGDDRLVRWIRVNETGFTIDQQGKVFWNSVSGVNLSVFVDKITLGPRYRMFSLDSRSTAKIRPMSGGGFVPELTHTLYYGVLTVYTTYNSVPAVEFKCRVPMIMPKRVLRRMKKIGKKNGTSAAFTFHVHKEDRVQETAEA